MKCSQCGAVHIVNNDQRQIPAGWSMVPGPIDPGFVFPECVKCTEQAVGHPDRGEGLGPGGAFTPEQADAYNLAHQPGQTT